MVSVVRLEMRWRDLLFLHREVDPATLNLPEGLEPDLFEGRAYQGHVPFRMEGVRPVGCPGIRRLSDFPETNLRTYVRLNGVPYVWFHRLETPNRTANALARNFFGLPYETAPVGVSVADGRVTYSGGAILGERGVLVATPGAEVAGDAFDRWCVQRDTFLVRHRGAWRIGRVHHAPYRLREVRVEGEIAFSHERAIFCDGVDVRADAITKLKP